MDLEQGARVDEPLDQSDRVRGVGFGLVLDGSERVDRVIRTAIPWDVMGGVARRAWARNPGSIETAARYNETHKGTDQITLPFLVDEEMLKYLVK